MSKERIDIKVEIPEKGWAKNIMDSIIYGKNDFWKKYDKRLYAEKREGDSEQQDRGF